MEHGLLSPCIAGRGCQPDCDMTFICRHWQQRVSIEDTAQRTEVKNSTCQGELIVPMLSLCRSNWRGSHSRLSSAIMVGARAVFNAGVKWTRFIRNSAVGRFRGERKQDRHFSSCLKPTPEVIPHWLLQQLYSSQLHFECHSYAETTTIFMKILYPIWYTVNLASFGNCVSIPSPAALVPFADAMITNRTMNFSNDDL